ncbi:histidine kinase [Enterococcus silesiacus]|nr:histidine kinase [Enterococcus silesiacus]
MRFIQQHESNLLLSNQFSDKQLNELLSLLNQMLIEQRSNKMTTKKQEQQLKDSIANLAHDIRTPLTSLDGYFQLLIKSKDSEKRQQYAEVIKNRIETLTELLETIFTYSKLENDAYKIELQKTEINQVLLDTIFTFYLQFSNEAIEPNISIGESQLYILANSAALTRIFSNLIKNSLDHGQGEIKISQAKERDQMLFRIQNKVTAESELDMSQIFDRFYMSDKSRAGNSTGLGLFIVKEFVEKMNGHIEAELIKQVFSISIRFPLLSDD